MSEITLSVLIPTFNRSAMLRRTLLALADQTYPPDSFEVIVAVDGSTDDTVAMLERLSTPYRLSFSWSPRTGTAPTRNRALSQATGEVVVSLDDDIVAHPDLLSAHASLHKNRDRVVGLGRLELFQEASLDRFARYWYRRFEEHYRKLAQPNYEPEFVDCLSGNMSVRRRYLLATGGFDPRFREHNHEDTELGYRLSQQGLSFVYLPAALGYHNFQKSFVQGCWDAYGDGRSSLILARKHPAISGRLRLTLRRRLPFPAPIIRWMLVNHLLPTATLIRAADALRPAVEALPLPKLSRFYYAAIFDACYWRGLRDQTEEDASS